MTMASEYMSPAKEGWGCVSSGVKSSGAVQSIGAVVSENGSNKIAFKPKSPRRARGGWSSLIRMFDCRGLQQGVIGFSIHGGKTYPSDVPVHQVHLMKELETTRDIDQLQGSNYQIPCRSIARRCSLVEVCWPRGSPSCN